MSKLVFVHTVFTAYDQFNNLAKEILPPDVIVYHVTDEILAKVVLAQGGLTPFLYRRVADHALAAQEAGADVVQLTCSSISPCADVAAKMVDLQVLKIDTPMVEQALSTGQRIGVAATAPTAMNPLADLVKVEARKVGKEVEVEATLCSGAYEALFSRGDADEHDRIVRETLLELMSRNDVVLLAQASMARVADTISPQERPVPLLASPRLAVERACTVITQMAR